MEERSNGGNLITAVILSVVVLFAWDYFFIPKNTLNNDSQIATNVTAKTDINNPVPVNQSRVNNPVNINKAPIVSYVPVRDSLEKTQANRLNINTDALSGSIDLTTGRFDDLTLNKHDKTLKSSQKIRLMAPADTEKGFFAEIDYSIAGNDSDKSPNQAAMWHVVSGDLDKPFHTVILSKDTGSINIKREIMLDNNYMFQITDTVTNNGQQNIAITPYGLVKENYPLSKSTESNYVVHTGFVGYLNNSLIEESYSSLKDDKYTDGSIDDSTGGWVGLTDKYWASVLIPPSNERLKVRGLYNPSMSQDGYQVDYTLKTRTLGAGESVTLNNKLFSGAKSVTLINKYHDNLKIQGFDFLVDWGWFWFFTRPIFKALLYLHTLVGNYGIAILLLTLALKSVFFPLANKSYTAMSKMKKLQPQMEKIKEKNAKDPMAQQQALIELYKKEKVNPVAGCWPMLLQIPVFFALYKVLNVALELRHQPFFGWINDLSAADPTNMFTLFGLIPFDMPSFLHIGIWPLLMGITMWMQQRLNPAPSDPVQAKLMSLFPIVFTFILAPFSAGLVIYWTWNNILSILQQTIIMKRLNVPIEFRLWKKS